MAVRLFVALDLPQGARAELARWRAPLLTRAGDRLRPVAPDALHVTLCFLGGQPEEAVGAIGAAVEAAVGDGGLPVPALALAAPRWLPRRRPRVLAVELDDGAGALGALQGRVADALVAGGWHAPERRPFLPHVTVARVRGDVALPLDVPPPAHRFAGAAVVLYRSRTDPRGARYEPLVRVVA